MAFILNIETSTEICSVCIAQKNEVLVLEESSDSYAHTRELTILIERCLERIKLKMNDLDAIAVSDGPGSYTGLRVGASTAKGICYALQKPLIAVDTLRSIAYATARQEKQEALYCPMIDARRMEVYTAIYNYENIPVTTTQSIIVDENFLNPYLASELKIIFSGNGAEKCRSVIHSPLAIFRSVVCSAAHLAPLSWSSYQSKNFKDVAYYSPTYLKAPNITIPRKVL